MSLPAGSPSILLEVQFNHFCLFIFSISETSNCCHYAYIPREYSQIWIIIIGIF
jgi:hypothetical protein